MIDFMEFRGNSIEKAKDHMNSFDWTGKEILGINCMNRHGTHIVRVWFR